MEMNFSVIDIGTNLFSSQFAGREEEIYQESMAAHVSFLITGSDQRSSLLAAEFAKTHPATFATLGVHPHAAQRCTKKVLEEYERLLTDPSYWEAVVAVGECGLDYDRMYSPKEDQLFWFEEQIKLAVKTGKPLFLHEREACEDFAGILSRYPEAAERAVVHCFTGNTGAIETYLSLGCMIGITGWVCDERRNGELLLALKKLPVERLMVETDAPYLLPRGKKLKNPNLPVNVFFVLEKLAELYGMEKETLQRIVRQNTCRFFDLSL